MMMMLLLLLLVVVVGVVVVGVMVVVVGVLLLLLLVVWCVRVWHLRSRIFCPTPPTAPRKPKAGASSASASPAEARPSPQAQSPQSQPAAGVASAAVESAPGENTGCTSLAEYNPAAKDYHPVKSACWAAGEHVPYHALAVTFSAIEGTTKRLEMVSSLRNFFRSVIALTPHELVPCIYLCTNDLAPAYEGIELGVGDSILMKAVGNATGRTTQQIKARIEELGDLGEVAYESRGKQKTLSFAKASKRLSVLQVFDKFTEIAKMSGNKSQQRKVDIIQSLIVACRESEAKYMVRALGGKLRIGLAETSVLVALGHAITFTPPSSVLPLAVVDASKGVKEEVWKGMCEENVLKMKTVFSECPNYGKIIPVLIDKG
jgi:DNA ligase-1